MPPAGGGMSNSLQAPSESRSLVHMVRALSGPAARTAKESPTGGLVTHAARTGTIKNSTMNLPPF